MKYTISPHARVRMKERGITEKDVENALQFPTKTLYNEKQRILFKKLYQKDKKEKLLLVAGQWRGKTLRVITVIETSKVKKYL